MTNGSGQSKLRAIPAVEKILQVLGEVDLPRAIVTAVVRRELESLRGTGQIPSFSDIVSQIRSNLTELRRSRIQPVLNGTGIVVHTNLGRSPMGRAVAACMHEVALHYNNLEMDLRTGERGGRASYLEHNLALLCGAEAATVVNNCAAALVLILRHFTSQERKEVIISRGELVQIGGGFRVPDILEASGAVLREVGATNKTSLEDYSRVLGAKTALILKVHRSNFFMGGFVESPSTEELAALAKKNEVPFVEDLGSGAVLPTESLGPIDHEPTPAEVLKRGVDLVCCSGDKLLGGPQAGLIAGGATLVGALKREPFYRALRCDKLILSALETTVDLYLRGRACEEVPTLVMLRSRREALVRRGEELIAGLEEWPVKGALVESGAQVGGGTLPRSVIPSIAVALQPRGLSLDEFAARLRMGSPPVIGYIAENQFHLDLRTIFPEQDVELLAAVQRALAPTGP